MSTWQDALVALRQEIDSHHRMVAGSAAKLESALKAYDAAIEASSRELDLLKQVDLALVNSSFDLDAVIALIVKGALGLTGGDFGQLLLPQDSEHLKIVWSTPGGPVAGLPVPVAGSVTGRAFRTGQAQHIGDTRTITDGYFEFVPGMTSELAVPMKSEDAQVLGVINIESSRPHAFTPHHREVAQLLASQTAIAFRNARLYAELTGILESQVDILSQTGSLRNTLALIGQRAKDIVGAEQCQVLRTDRDALVIEFTTGSEQIGTRVLITDSISGLAAKSGKTHIIADVLSDPEAKTLYKAVLPGMRSEMVVPLTAGGDVLGVINLESPLPRLMTPK